MRNVSVDSSDTRQSHLESPRFKYPNQVPSQSERSSESTTLHILVMESFTDIASSAMCWLDICIVKKAFRGTGKGPSAMFVVHRDMDVGMNVTRYASWSRAFAPELDKRTKKLEMLSPAVAVLLARHSINASLIIATGPKNNILKGDVMKYLLGVTSSSFLYYSMRIDASPLISRCGNSLGENYSLHSTLVKASKLIAASLASTTGVHAACIVNNTICISLPNGEKSTSWADFAPRVPVSVSLYDYLSCSKSPIDPVAVPNADITMTIAKADFSTADMDSPARSKVVDVGYFGEAITLPIDVVLDVALIKNDQSIFRIDKIFETWTRILNNPEILNKL